MNRLRKFVGGLVLAAALTPAVAGAEDKDIIEYRQHLMNALDQQAAALGMIMSYAVPDEHTVKHFQIVALVAKTSLEAFEPEVHGGEANPEVWNQWADFAERMNKFAEDSDMAAKAGLEQGKQGAMNHVLDALPCKACHDDYREESE